jgi:hypothetical protein
MPLSSKASDIVQNIFTLYDFTGFTQLWHSIFVATKCNEFCIFIPRGDGKACSGIHHLRTYKKPIKPTSR